MQRTLVAAQQLFINTFVIFLHSTKFLKRVEHSKSTDMVIKRLLKHPGFSISFFLIKLLIKFLAFQNRFSTQVNIWNVKITWIEEEKRGHLGSLTDVMKNMCPFLGLTKCYQQKFSIFIKNGLFRKFYHTFWNLCLLSYIQSGSWSKHFYTQSWASEGFFSTGGHCFFFQKFSGGAKVVKFVFSHQKLKKQPFLLKFPKAPAPLSTSMYTVCANYLQKLVKLA